MGTGGSVFCRRNVFSRHGWRRYEEAKIMNIPNKLTVLRMIIIPFFVVFMMFNILGAADKWVALLLFVIASLTDFADGKIARAKNLVTNFGKLMDPLADKLLVCSALICLVNLGKIPAWIVIIVIAREFLITGVRQIAQESGRVIAASCWGKFKTTSQMIMIIFMIIDIPDFYLITEIFMWAALALTLISMFDYLIKNRDVIVAGGL